VQDQGFTYVLTKPDSVHGGPEETLQDYEAAMLGITETFSTALAEVTVAVQQGKLSSEQGKTISGEVYMVTQMQFELLSAWRHMVEQDLPRVLAPAQTDPAPAKDSEIVVVELPFSSFELTQSVAQYLNLTQSQVQAIQQLMTSEPHRVQPLRARLRTAGEKLQAAPEHTSNREIKKLAHTQAALMAELIVANARLRSRIYSLLTPEQQKRLDDLEQGGDSGTSTSKLRSQGERTGALVPRH
jgi:Spy/CpxP family protein refolding chaperone